MWSIIHRIKHIDTDQERFYREVATETVTTGCVCTIAEMSRSRLLATTYTTKRKYMTALFQNATTTTRSAQSDRG